MLLCCSFFLFFGQQRTQAAALSAQSGKIRREILQEQEEAAAEQHLKKIIRIEGGLEQIKQQVGLLTKNFLAEETQIKEKMEKAQAKLENLVKAVATLEAKLIPPPVVEPKPVTKKPVTVRPTPRIKKAWYEKIISYVALSFINVRDTIRRGLGIKPTVTATSLDVVLTDTAIPELEAQIGKLKEPEQKAFAKKVHTKLKAMEGERAKLLKKLAEKKIAVKESLWCMVKRIFRTVFRLIKRIFFGIGRTINSLVNLGADIEPEEPIKKEVVPPAVQPKAETVPVQKEIVKAVAIVEEPKEVIPADIEEPEVEETEKEEIPAEVEEEEEPEEEPEEEEIEEAEEEEEPEEKEEEGEEPEKAESPPEA